MELLDLFSNEVRMLRPFAAAVAVIGSLFLASCRTVQQPAVKNTSRSFTTVVVDAGHGGKDNGAFRRYGPPEKQAALDVATRLGRKLRESQFRVVMTRTSDVFIPLDERAAIGRAQKNSIFVAIHFNDTSRRGIHGFEVYYHSAVAYPLAQRVMDRLLTIRGAVNRGVHHANFRVLRKAIYPSVLVECGFLSNRTEGSEAGSSAYREQLADKIAEAIVDTRYGRGVYAGPAPAATGGSTVEP
ncbi:MAG: N-acetylmuramoyl-L-alanine amidase [Chthoniobacterales bacterium]